VNRRFVHHLHAAGDDAGADDVGDAPPAVLAGGESRPARRGRFRSAQEADGHLGDNAEQASGAGHKAEQVLAFAVQVLAAEADHLAVSAPSPARGTLLAVSSVCQAMLAAGILGTLPPIEQAICEDGRA
jgi:hypothetical protein